MLPMCWPIRYHKGLTKDKEYRRQQLKSFLKLFNENQQDIINVVEKDLHKHKIEIISGEIAPVVGEIEYMLAVSIVNSRE